MGPIPHGSGENGSLYGRGGGGFEETRVLCSCGGEQLTPTELLKTGLYKFIKKSCKNLVSFVVYAWTFTTLHFG